MVLINACNVLSKPFKMSFGIAKVRQWEIQQKIHLITCNEWKIFSLLLFSPSASLCLTVLPLRSSALSSRLTTQTTSQRAVCPSSQAIRLNSWIVMWVVYERQFCLYVISATFYSNKCQTNNVLALAFFSGHVTITNIATILLCHDECVISNRKDTCDLQQSCRTNCAI